MSVTIIPGDNRASLRRLIDEGVRVHAVVTDPPYGLTSKSGAGGFMGKTWDGTGIERDPEFWRLVWEILLPGGCVFAFSGSRTGHWQACAMEQAGFIMHPMHVWMFGSGFPKAHNSSAAIEKMRRADAEPTRAVCRYLRAAMDGLGLKSADLTSNFGNCHSRLIDHWAARDTDSQPSLPTPEQWAILARVLQLDGTMDAEVARLNARKGEFGEAYKAREIVGTVDEWNNRTNYALTSRDGLRRGDAVTPEAAQWDGWFHGTQTQKPAIEPIYLAQRPFSEKTGAANLLKHGVGAFNVDATRVPKVAGDISGWSISGSSESENLSMSGKNYARAPKSDAPGRWPANLLHDGSPEVVALFPTPHGAGAARKGAFGGQYDATSYDLGKPREMGRFGDSGSAARFFNSFAPDDIPIAFYAPKASKADRAGSSHPTVKPIALMRHLIRHICPPGGTVLDPFAGSGTTGEAARIEGFDCILMESEPEYVEFLRNRFSQPMPTQDVVKRPAEAKEARQLELFDTPKAAE